MELLEIKNKIFKKAQKQYDKEWLKYHELNIGDVVKANFPSSYGTSKNSYTTSTDCDAKIIVSEDGTLKLESTIPIKHSRSKSNGRTGRNYRSWWEYFETIDRINLERIKLK